MELGPIIRKARSDDVLHLLPLVQEFVTSFELDPRSYQATYRRVLHNDSACALVAEHRGQIVGYLLGFIHDTFYANGQVAWVEEIMVHAEHRRAGLGTSLMRCFESWCEDRGAMLSALATRRASDFYEAIGYKASATYLRRVLQPT